MFPVWSRPRQELLYWAPDGHVMVVEYTVNGDIFVPAKPRRWSDRRIATTGGPNFDLSPDGTRLVVPLADSPETDKGSLHVTFLLNYFDELRRRMPPQ
jgi:hypothetical protein